MNDKKIVLALVIIAVLSFSACQQYDSEDDFEFMKNESEVIITRYMSLKPEVRIPPSIQKLPVARIEKEAFYKSTNSISITIPNKVTGIGEGAFNGCAKLISIDIPDKVTTIGEKAFAYCTRLAEIKVAANNSEYTSEEGALFDKNKTTLIACPAGKTGDFIIPKGVTIIGESAFNGCAGLINVNIPYSVTSIGINSFDGCSSLLAINIDPYNTKFNSESGILYNKDKTILIFCPKGKKGAVFIPNGVTRIEEYAFKDCTSLTSVNISDSVINIGEGAFSNCIDFTSITMPNGVTSIENKAFKGCASLTSVNMPNSVISIGDRAFEGCKSLTGINIPNSVKSIGKFAFSNCENLIRITFNGTIPASGFSVNNSGDDLRDKFYATNKVNGTPGTYTRPNGTSKIWTRI